MPDGSAAGQKGKKKKGKKKQSRFKPGEGYRPDRKSIKKKKP